MNIYLAAPLFNPREIEWNQKVCDFLEREGHDVFLPQRDGGKSAELMAMAKTAEDIEKARINIFKKDYEAISSCDLVVFITDGPVLDVGACAEVGIAYSLLKPVVALHQDVRSFIQGRMNLFVEGCISTTVTTLEDLTKEVERFSKIEF